MASRSFEETLLPHLDAAFNYARWLTRSDADAEEAVQEAYLRALRFFPSLRSDDARPWLFAIVRNACFARAPRSGHVDVPFDEATNGGTEDAMDPEALVIQRQTVDRVRGAIEELPADFREVIVLRELEGLSYKEIALVAGIPLGTVMSRLARARERLIVLLDTDAAPGLKTRSAAVERGRP